MKITIPDDFLGTCSTCRKTKEEVESGAPWQPKEAKHKVYVPFSTPVPASGRFPEVKGIWCYICDDCAAERGLV